MAVDTAGTVRTFQLGSSVLAVVSACIALGLVVAWAQNRDKHTDSFLGVPTKIAKDFSANVFAYHPVLMVAGFVFGQVLAVNSWTLIGNHDIAKIVHVFWQMAGIGCMAAGLTAVVRDKYNAKDNSLTSIHSWVGVAGIAMFGWNYIWGFFMAVLTQFFPDCSLRQTWDLVFIHRVFGLTALGLTVIAVISGIMQEFGEEGCFYTTNISTADANPSLHYQRIPNGCKIANGMGLVVIFAAVFTVLTVSLRGKLAALERDAHPVKQVKHIEVLHKV